MFIETAKCISSIASLVVKRNGSGKQRIDNEIIVSAITVERIHREGFGFLRINAYLFLAVCQW